MDDFSPVVGDGASGFRELVSAFPNGVLVLFDGDYRYRIVGPDVLPFSERTAREMMGKTIYELFPEETVENLEDELRETLSGSSRSFDMAYDGNIHHLETRPVTIDGERFGVLVTQEVTEARETTAALAEKTQRLEMVASVLSHDLRNPLSVALGYLDVLEAESAASSDSTERVRQALTRMDTIIGDALVLARDTTLSAVEPLDLGAQVEAAWRVVPTGSATLDVVESPTIDADPGLLGNLLENLFRNAISHAGPDVTVRVGQLAPGPGFYVEDDGPGIDPAIRDTVFDPGVSTGNGEDHSGLGLSIVREIASAHGWECTLEDRNDGGARFEFRTDDSTSALDSATPSAEY